jgi:hypothetical protein
MVLSKTLVAHASPQSWRNTPTPNIPLAPNACTVSFSGPVREHVTGTTAKPGSPITWTGSRLACSPAIFRSASLTGPQVLPSAKWAHSATGMPLASVCCGSESDAARTGDMIRSPTEPVSTRTWSMV